ncbi:MAG: hypothetical protein WC835_03675 [Candidatus Paceibacterota bacterium]
MNLEELKNLKKRRFFRESPLHVQGYQEKVPGKSVIAQKKDGKQVIITGFFAEEAVVYSGKVQYHDGRQFRYLPADSLSVVETVPPFRRKAA